MIQERFTPEKSGILVMFLIALALLLNFLRINTLDKEFAQIYINLLYIALPLGVTTLVVSRGKILPIADLLGKNSSIIMGLGAAVGLGFAMLGMARETIFPHFQLTALATQQHIFAVEPAMIWKNVGFIGVLAPIVEEMVFLSVFFVLLFALKQRVKNPLGWSMFLSALVFALFHFAAYSFAYPGAMCTMGGVWLFLTSGPGASAVVFRLVANYIGYVTESYLGAIALHVVVNSTILVIAGGLVPISTLLLVYGGFLLAIAAISQWRGYKQWI